MKHFNCVCLSFLLGLCSIPCFSATPRAFNRIEGQVFDPQRQPVENARVELDNEVYSMVGTTKTTSAGRFTFSGMGPGHYTIKVMPFGTNLMEQSQDVYVTNLTPRSSDIAYVEFHLLYDKHITGGTALARSPDAIFVQEIPDDAKKLYEDGIDLLKKDHSAGLAKLEEAVKVFPTYFDALNVLGSELVKQKEYEKAYPFLMKATDVNPRSSVAFYQLGFSFYQLKRYLEAFEPAKASATLVPASFNGQLLYGTILRILRKYPEAEETLTKADKLAKGTVAETHMQLALLYNRTNRNDDAVTELQKYLKLEPNSPDKAQIQNLIAKLKNSATTPK